MTIKVEAWQSAGIKQDHCVEEFEFCCWQELYDWLSTFTSLHKCPECQKKLEEKS